MKISFNLLLISFNKFLKNSYVVMFLSLLDITVGVRLNYLIKPFIRFRVLGDGSLLKINFVNSAKIVSPLLVSCNFFNFKFKIIKFVNILFCLILFCSRL